MKIEIRTTVLPHVLDKYNEIMRKAEQADMYEISNENVGDCAEDILRDIADCSNEQTVVISADYLKEEIRWNLTEKLITLANQAKEDEEITPKECAAIIRRYRRMNLEFVITAENAAVVPPWLITEIEDGK